VSVAATSVPVTSIVLGGAQRQRPAVGDGAVDTYI